MRRQQDELPVWRRFFEIWKPKSVVWLFSGAFIYLTTNKSRPILARHKQDWSTVYVSVCVCVCEWVGGWVSLYVCVCVCVIVPHWGFLLVYSGWQHSKVKTTSTVCTCGWLPVSGANLWLTAVASYCFFNYLDRSDILWHGLVLRFFIIKFSSDCLRFIAR